MAHKEGVMQIRHKLICINVSKENAKYENLSANEWTYDAAEYLNCTTDRSRRKISLTGVELSSLMSPASTWAPMISEDCLEMPGQQWDIKMIIAVIPRVLVWCAVSFYNRTSLVAPLHHSSSKKIFYAPFSCTSYHGILVLHFRKIMPAHIEW